MTSESKWRNFYCDAAKGPSSIIRQERLFVCLRVCLFDRYAFKNYASYSKTKDIVGISVSMSRFLAQVRQSMAVINGFNGYPHFLIFWPEMLYVTDSPILTTKSDHCVKNTKCFLSFTMDCFGHLIQCTIRICKNKILIWKHFLETEARSRGCDLLSRTHTGHVFFCQ